MQNQQRFYVNWVGCALFLYYIKASNSSALHESILTKLIGGKVADGRTDIQTDARAITKLYPSEFVGYKDYIDILVYMYEVQVTM